MHAGVAAALFVASRWGGSEDFDQLLLEADQAVYRAKDLGRNRTEVTAR